MNQDKVNDAEGRFKGKGGKKAVLYYGFTNSSDVQRTSAHSHYLKI